MAICLIDNLLIDVQCCACWLCGVGIDNLTVVQQRVIAIFAFATLMWILEVVSSWATSIAIIVLMLLFCTDSGISPLVQEEEVGKLLSYKGVMACFADPVIMLFIGGFVRCYEDRSRCTVSKGAVAPLRHT